MSLERVAIILDKMYKLLAQGNAPGIGKEVRAALKGEASSSRGL